LWDLKAGDSGIFRDKKMKIEEIYWFILYQKKKGAE
jgi:hypothetical protein